jgi:hypothetical protein
MAASANLRMSSDGISNLVTETNEVTSDENCTMVAADIGQPEDDIKSAFQVRVKFDHYFP